MSESVESEKIDPEDIPEFGEESFTGAEKMANLEKLKELLGDAKGLFGKISNTIDDFNKAGKGLVSLVDEAKGLMSQYKGEGDDGKSDPGSDSSGS